MHRIVMNLVFQRLPMLPKEEGIYWCIVKSKDETSPCTPETSKTGIPPTYHYVFVEFRGHFVNPVLKGFTLEVVAWAELENPERHFKPKPLIISR